jgi:hypothetical protein
MAGGFFIGNSHCRLSFTCFSLVKGNRQTGLAHVCRLTVLKGREEVPAFSCLQD